MLILEVSELHLVQFVIFGNNITKMVNYNLNKGIFIFNFQNPPIKMNKTLHGIFEKN